MAKESMLTLEEREAIQIEKFIFHIIIKEDVNPRFLDAVEISDDQRNFFKARLADAAQGRQYLFNDYSETKEKSIQILSAVDEGDFIRLSREIAYKFKSTHNKNTNNGVFIICTASTLRNRKLLFLVKLDHKKIYQYKVNDNNQALLQEVQDTFTEDKTAIQKFALIDVNPDVKWDVLVYDRSSRAELGNITEYFKSFLGVYVRETEDDLTRKAVRTTREWATLNKSILNPNQGVATYKNLAQSYLNNHEIFDTDKFIEAVIQDENEDRRAILKASFLQHLENIGLAYQEFHINKNALNKKITKNIRETAEGVKIEWEGTENDKNIEISDTPDANGLYTIRIQTRRVIDIQ